MESAASPGDAMTAMSAARRSHRGLRLLEGSGRPCTYSCETVTLLAQVRNTDRTLRGDGRACGKRQCRRRRQLLADQLRWRRARVPRARSATLCRGRHLAVQRTRAWRLRQVNSRERARRRERELSRAAAHSIEHAHRQRSLPARSPTQHLVMEITPAISRDRATLEESAGGWRGGTRASSQTATSPVRPRSTSSARLFSQVARKTVRARPAPHHLSACRHASSTWRAARRPQSGRRARIPHPGG